MKWILYLEPVSQGRPRTVRMKNGHVMTYTPEKTKNFREAVLLLLQQDRPEYLLEGAIKLTIRFYRSIPRSWSKKKTRAAVEGDIMPVSKPDLDNYTKAVKDSMKGVVWVDDSQVVEYGVGHGKYYSEVPRIEIEVEEIKSRNPLA